MSPASPSDVLDRLVGSLQAEGFQTVVETEPHQQVIVRLPDPRLDPWEDPNEERIIEIVRIELRDDHLHCPWLPAPIPASEADSLGEMIATLMETRGY